jgi:hypothetical protein
LLSEFVYSLSAGAMTNANFPGPMKDPDF